MREGGKVGEGEEEGEGGEEAGVEGVCGGVAGAEGGDEVGLFWGGGLVGCYYWGRGIWRAGKREVKG